MNFAQVESEYRRLKAQVAAGQISEDEFKAKLQELMIQDEQGRWWVIGFETGQWYVHDGEQWVPAQPPHQRSLVGARPHRLPELSQSHLLRLQPRRKSAGCAIRSEALVVDCARHSW